MKYCDNCGAELQDDVNFCDECGNVQNEISISDSDDKQSKQTPKKSKKTPIIIATIIVMILIFGGICILILNQKNTTDIDTENVTEEIVDVIEEEIVEEIDTSLLGTITWEYNSEKIQEIKSYNLIGYQAVTINQAFESYNVKSWSYGLDENIEYLLVEYEENSNTYTLIINATLLKVEEIYIDDVILDDVDSDELINSIFDVEISFIGKSGSYSTVGATLNIVIEDEIVTSAILVDYYEEALVGKIVSSTEADVYLESGEVIRYTWLDEDTVVSNPVDGFSQETINMIRTVCEALNGTVFTYDSNTLSENENADFVAIYMPTIGTYYNTWDSAIPDTYELVIHSTTNNSFIFSVTEDINSNGEMVFNVIIDKGVAEFDNAEDWYAYYKDDTYDIQFDCSYEGDIYVAGYEPMTRITSKYFLNVW